MARRANQPQLTREQIVSAALRLVDEHGLEAHSMRQLGAALGVDPTSVYHYISGKSELYDLLMDAVISEGNLTVFDARLGVEELLLTVGRELRRVLLLHPQVVPLFATRSFRTLEQLRPLERIVPALEAKGFSAAEIMTTMNVVGTYAIALTNVEVLHRAQARPVGDYLPTEETLATLPHLQRLFADPSAYAGIDAEFEAGLSALVAGLLARQRIGALLP